ncbi:hypothetical protein NN561_019884 [Cricetulus griseus]
MTSRKKRPHVGEQHVAEGDDFVKLTPRKRHVAKGTNTSSGQKSAVTTSLQSPIPRRPRGRPATKDPSVDRGLSDETTCTVEKNPPTEKDGVAEKRYIVTKYCVLFKTPLGEMLQLHDSNCKEEETSVTGKRASAIKHQSKKQLSGKTHHVSEKSSSFEKHLSAEKDIPTIRGYLNKKIRLTERGRSTEEVGLAERDSYGKRGHPGKRSQPAKKCLSTKKSQSPRKVTWMGEDPLQKPSTLKKKTA